MIGCGSSEPDRGLLGPWRVGVALDQRSACIAKRGAVAGRLVASHTGPVERLRRRIAGGELLDDALHPVFRLLPALVAQGPARESELELRQKVLLGQKSLDPMALGAVGVGDQQGRRPLRAEALEGLRLLLDVDLDRYEAAGDQLFDLSVGVDLGIQPSTSASERCGVEVEQQGGPTGSRFLHRLVDIPSPLDRHEILPLERSVYLARYGRRSPQ